MSNDVVVRVDRVDKVFHTHHFFRRNEETGLRRLYERRTVHAVDHVEFGIRRGEIFGLLGPNGAGKTTTVKMLSGLIRPTSGAVYIDGLNVETKRQQILRRIGVVLEGTRTVIWPLTPLENLTYFGNLRDVRGKVLRRRARELLEFIGLKDKMDVQVRKLSRGQKQKLAICIALITDPPVILLDEPTTGLDVQSSRNIKDKVIEMTRNQGKCVLVTTHDMNVAQELCDRIGIINQGALVACRPTAELLGLFADPGYELRLDRALDASLFTSVPGVVAVAPLEDGGGPAWLLRLTPEAELRSAALYETLARLRAEGVLLRSIHLRQQRLEDVFLQLTNQPKAKGTG